MIEPDNYEKFIVDDRKFLLGLNHLYRESMKECEKRELLECARSLAAALNVSPENVPLEGYYEEDAALEEYFGLIRSLQNQGIEKERSVNEHPGFQRLCEVMSSPIFGQAHREETLLPLGRDSLYYALEKIVPDWTVERVVNVSKELVERNDDISLVGLAAYAKDPVALTLLRESVVPYADLESLGEQVTSPVYRWEVDEGLAHRANRFIETFNRLTNSHLPRAEQDNAAKFYEAYDDDDYEFEGCCVRIGKDESEPPNYYHWAVVRDAQREFNVNEFWHEEIWTTTRFRKERIPEKNFW